MIELFFMGGTLFMSILTLLFIGTIVSAFKFPDYVKDLGILSLTMGILGQVIGLYGMFEGIESFNGQVSPALVAGGIKVSTITTIYGFFIYIISTVIQLILKSRLS